MTIFLGRFSLLLLLILPTTIMLAGPDGSSSIVARADDTQDDIVEDVIEGEEDEDDGTVETEDGSDTDGMATDSTSMEAEEKDEDEEEEKPLKPSDEADTYILFTKPTVATDLPAGKTVRFLVGFTNKGSKEFLVETMDASFRYPQDYSFFIQNFTTARYNHAVEPNRQATFEYSFTPSETFNARPFGLTINLNYKDSEGNIFQDAVYNDTINITEPDEGLDGETFFLYLFLAAVIVLLLVGAQQLLTSFGKKRLSKPKPVVEMGTQNKGDVDYDWLPKETLDSLNKSPRRSPKSKTSPRQRRTNRSSGAADD